jgi:uncharacterized protein
MQPKTERFEMRLDPGILERVDTWRSRRADLPSRAEAIRRLTEMSLSDGERRPLQFSDGEKLISLMLCDLYKHLGLESGIDPFFVEAAIFGGHYWALEWEYTGIFHGHEDRRATVSEVVNVLGMWDAIERAAGSLSKEARDRLAEDAGPRGASAGFPGFDGNNEGEYLSIACFLIEKMDRFSAFKDRSLNSHMPTLKGYRRMLAVFEPMQTTLVGGDLNMEQLVRVLNAWSGP